MAVSGPKKSTNAPSTPPPSSPPKKADTPKKNQSQPSANAAPGKKDEFVDKKQKLDDKTNITSSVRAGEAEVSGNADLTVDSNGIKASAGGTAQVKALEMKAEIQRQDEGEFGGNTFSADTRAGGESVTAAGGSAQGELHANKDGAGVSASGSVGASNKSKVYGETTVSAKDKKTGEMEELFSVGGGAHGNIGPEVGGHFEAGWDKDKGFYMDAGTTVSPLGGGGVDFNWSANPENLIEHAPEIQKGITDAVNATGESAGKLLDDVRKGIYKAIFG